MEHEFDGPPTCITNGTGFTGMHCLHSVGHNKVRCCGPCGGAYTDPTTSGFNVPEDFSYRLGFWHTQPGPLWPAVKSGNGGRKDGGAMNVPVREISDERLRRWLADCVRDHTTPIALVAVGHNLNAGAVHVYRNEDGLSDQELGALMGQVAGEMMRGNGLIW